jgi:hypothetical protein
MHNNIFKRAFAFGLTAALLAGVSPFSFSPPVEALAASATPNVTEIHGVANEYERKADVTMDGHKVSSQRYVAMVDGIGYDAYCADPKLPGPENPAAVYELAGPGKDAIKTVLKNGFPANSEWSNLSADADDRMWNAYVTRVGVAIANNPGSTFAGDMAAVEQARQLVNGTIKADMNAYPPIMLNGKKDASDTGRTISGADAQSQDFAVTYNRKINGPANPFRFEWAAGTPDGAKLIVDGNVVATAPANHDTVYGAGIKSFQIEMPNTAEYVGKTATVNLVGIHNQFADTVWMMQNPNDPKHWQDILFYIPEVSASAAFSFDRDPETPDEAELRIVKRDSSGKGLSGASFTSQTTTTSSGGLTLAL